MNSNIHFQYYNSNALVVVNTKGQIRTLYTSFKVMCLVAIAAKPKGTYVYVEEVLSNALDQLQHVINGQLGYNAVIDHRVALHIDPSQQRFYSSVRKSCFGS